MMQNSLQRKIKIETIAKLRDDHNLTFGQIAQRLDVDRSTACRMYHEGTDDEQKPKAST